MAAKKVGELIKEARTDAGLTQEALAKKIPGLSAQEISKAERGEGELTQDQLKAIAKATGVTQKSLLEAPKGKSKASSGAAAKKPAKTDAIGELTAAEKKLIQLYRAAGTKDKQLAKTILEGKAETGEILLQILGNKVASGDVIGSLGNTGNTSGAASDLVGSLLGGLLGKK